jgi:mannitol/fructose-specific phosphotransferase system IIA component (Ntr-type)
MRVQDLLQPTDIVLGFRPADKWDAIDQLITRLVESERIPADVAPDVHDAVVARERSMSTGMERGIAIPHAAVAELEDVVACLAVTSADGRLEFQSIDAGPTRLLVLLVIPRAQKLLHIRTLADVARLLGDDEVREGLFAATTPEEAWRALGAGDGEADSAS